MYLKELTQFGMSEKEAKVYLALLEVEVGTVQEIAKTAGINRSSTYVVLEALQKRGLVSVSAGKKIKRYVVEPPDRLVQMAEHAARTQVDVKSDLAAILPDLKSIYKGTKQKPGVRIYGGKQGMISAFEETLKMNERVIRIVSSTDDIQKTLPDYLPGYVKARMEKGIVMRGIHPYTDQANYLRENITKSIDNVQLISPEKWKFKSDFAIFDNTVAFMLHKEQTAIHIDNSAIADGMKQIFDLAFEEAKRLNVSSKRSFPRLPKASKRSSLRQKVKGVKRSGASPRRSR